MKKARLSFLGLFIAVLLASPLYAQRDATLTVSHDELTQQSIRDRVKVLRNERYEKMPYLNKGYINSTIYPQKIIQKTNFVSSGAKTIKDVIGRAIQVSTPARAAHERISLAKRRIIVALRELFPELTTQFQKKVGELSGDSYNSRDYKFSFRQPLFRGGILWNTLLQEKSGLEAAQKENDKVLADLVNDVSAAYFEYQRTIEVMQDQQSAIEQVRRYVKISQEKLKEQFISEIENLNVESLFSQMEYDYETSKQELELAKLELQRFLDLNPQDPVEITEYYEVSDFIAITSSPKADSEQPQPPVEEEPALPANTALPQTVIAKQRESLSEVFKESVAIPGLDRLVDTAYEHRPELQVESAKLQSARLEQKIRWGELVPHLDAVMEFGKLGEAFNSQSTDPGMRTNWHFMLELTWNAAGNKVNYTYDNDQRAPSVTQFQDQSGSRTIRNTLTVGVLDGLDAFVNIKEAEVAKLDQVIELENAEKQVIHDVKQAYFDYQKAIIQVQSTSKRVDYRERLARLAEHRISKNEIEISEYVQAEIDLMHDKAELHRAIKDYLTAKAALNRAVGVREFLPIEEEKYGK